MVYVANRSGAVGRRKGCGDAEDVCISIQHGKNDGKVTLDNEAGTLNGPGDACAHDSSQDVHFAPFNGFRVVVTVVLLESAKDLSQQAKEELHELGFPGWQGHGRSRTRQEKREAVGGVP